MSRRGIRGENPDRLYTVTGGRSRVDQDSVDMVTLIVSESGPTPGMQSEYVNILQLCGKPMAVVELSSHLGLPVSVVKILVSDLLSAGQVSARHPSATRNRARLPQRANARRPASRPPLPDPAFLKEVLIGLEKL
jgi:Protein of unknown function (DUF742)